LYNVYRYKIALNRIPVAPLKLDLSRETLDLTITWAGNVHTALWEFQKIWQNGRTTISIERR